MIPWIKIETSLPRKPEVMQLADILGIDEFAVVGHLVCFWSWVDENVSQECPVVTGTKRGLDRVAGRDGFAAAMVDVGWLQMEGNEISIPHLDYHLDHSAKTRATEQRKKAKQRAKPVESRTCPDATGTKSGTIAGQKGGPEKSRGEETESVYMGGIDEIVIPKKMDTAECRDAAAKWFTYLSQMGADYKRVDCSAIALQDWWREMARIGPKEFPKAVQSSIAKALLNVRKGDESAYDGSKPQRATEDRTDWHQALTVCRRYPSGSQQDSEERKIQMTPEQLQAARAVGFQRIAGSTSYDVKQIEAEFVHAMKGRSHER